MVKMFCTDVQFLTGWIVFDILRNKSPIPLLSFLDVQLTDFISTYPIHVHHWTCINLQKLYLTGHIKHRNITFFCRFQYTTCSSTYFLEECPMACCKQGNGIKGEFCNIFEPPNQKSVFKSPAPKFYRLNLIYYKHRWVQLQNSISMLNPSCKF